MCPDQNITHLLGRRYLKSFAGGIAHKFSASAEHYAYMVMQHRVHRVTIDLLSLKISPPEFDIPRNRNLAWMCQQSLLDCARRLLPPARVVKAFLTADFDLVTAWPDVSDDCLGPSAYTVTLIDERGKGWRNVRRKRETWLGVSRPDSEVEKPSGQEWYGMSNEQVLRLPPGALLALRRDGGGRPQDLERVASVLRVIRRRNPRLQLGQILGAAIPPGRDLSNLWDDELIRHLEKLMSTNRDAGGEAS